MRPAAHSFEVIFALLASHSIVASLLHGHLRSDVILPLSLLLRFLIENNNHFNGVTNPCIIRSRRPLSFLRPIAAAIKGRK